ncbi:MAG: hypothetical protein AB8G14_09815 [Ilumatobacter sp.]
MTSHCTAVAIVSTLLLAACGGGGSDDTAAGDTTPAGIETGTAAPVPTASVETTIPTAVATEATVPVETVEVVETVETVAVEPDAAFCEAAENFFVPARALDFGDINDPAVLGTVITLLDGLAQPAIDAAPTDADARILVDSKALLDLAAPALTSIGFDLDRSGELDNGAEVGQALIDFGALLGELQVFLVDRCSSSIADLDERAMSIADGIVTTPATSAPESVPVTTPTAEEFTAIQNDTGDLRAEVPSAWTDVTGTPDGVLQQLAAAPNLQAFLDSYIQPGMLLITGDAANPDAWRDGLSTTVGIALEDGCTISDTADYDDGVYTGEENLLSCGDATSVAHIIGGRNSEGSLFFLLAIVRPVDDPGVRDQIVQSFFID